ncbi:MAG TPA: hypothetical protein VFZ86_12325 [Thermoleophilia bacterium]|nr:hypothetical protein [Thermoleophilia bacterium]
MDRIVSIDHIAGSARDENVRAERLRHRRAAQERCRRAGLLRRCTPVLPDGTGCCRDA